MAAASLFWNTNMDAWRHVNTLYSFQQFALIVRSTNFETRGALIRPCKLNIFNIINYECIMNHFVYETSLNSENKLNKT